MNKVNLTLFVNENKKTNPLLSYFIYYLIFNNDKGLGFEAFILQEGFSP